MAGLWLNCIKEWFFTLISGQDRWKTGSFQLPVTSIDQDRRHWDMESTMSDMALPGSIEPALKKGPDLDNGFHPMTGIIYLGVVAAALLFVAYSIYSDIDATGTRVTSI